MRKTYDVQIPDLEFQARGWLLSCGGCHFWLGPYCGLPSRQTRPLLLALGAYRRRVWIFVYR